jgi:uncharacterized protein YfaS (alpha-2-macroglobulin family)
MGVRGVEDVPVILVVEDDQLVQTMVEVALSDGGFEPAIAASGEEGDRLSGNCSFQVQQYRPNAFEITIPPPPAVTGPAQLDLAIAAKYFMGKPLVKAKLVWSLVARDDGFKPERLDDFAFCNAIEDFRLNRALDRISQFNAQGEAEVDAAGVARVATSLPINAKAPQPRAAKLLCEVTDLSQQTVSESRAFVQQSSDFYFGFRRFDAVFKEGAPLPIDLIAVTPDGKTLPAPVKSKLRLRRITWQTNRLATAGDTTEFDSKAQIEEVWERELSTTPGLGTDRKPLAATLPDSTQIICRYSSLPKSGICCALAVQGFQTTVEAEPAFSMRILRRRLVSRISTGPLVSR